MGYAKHAGSQLWYGKHNRVTVGALRKDKGCPQAGLI